MGSDGGQWKEGLRENVSTALARGDEEIRGRKRWEVDKWEEEKWGGEGQRGEYGAGQGMGCPGPRLTAARRASPVRRGLKFFVWA